MRKVGNPGILHIGGEGEAHLLDSENFQHVCNGLPRPQFQKPRIVHLIGRRQKTLALRGMLSQNNVQRAPTEYFAALRADLSTTNHDSPVFYLDSDPFPSRTQPAQGLNSRFIQSHSLSWLRPDSTLEAVSDILHARLLFPFVDVICVFLDDFLDAESLFQKLEDWIRLGPGSNVDRAVRPRLFVVSRATHLPADTAKLLGGLHDIFSEMFSMVQPVLLTERGHHRLKEVVLTNATEVLNLKQQRCLSFSAIHLGELFRVAVAHCTKTQSEPFDFLKAAWTLAGNSRDLSQHLHRFFQLCQRLHISFSDTVFAISSALLVNAFPPGMHVFEPAWIFREYYEPACSVAFRQSDYELADSYSRAVCTMFTQCTEALANGRSSIDLRLASLTLNPKLWTAMRSSLTCLFCLSNNPEPPVLPCGHSICETCILRCARNIPHLEFHFFIEKCFICQAPAEVTVKIKPPTAGIRLLSTDGGGTRAVIPLESLNILQKLLDPIPVREFFDLGMGTSSGGLIELGIFAKPLDLDACSDAFEALSRKVFDQPTQRSSIFGSFKRLLRSWTTDGVYDPEVLESNLKAVFGATKRLFGAPLGPFSGYRCAVVTSSIADAAPIVLGNYNGSTPNHLCNGYEVFRPESVEDEPFIWEAARATTAAPGLFSTARVGDRDFQDGGLKHNNPCLLALWESRRIWPEIESLDLFLSLGTGRPKETDRTRDSRFRHFLLDGFIPRLLRSCIAKTDGDILWAQLMNCLDDQSRSVCFRANVPLHGPAQIDDTKSLAALRANVRKDTDLSATLLKVAKAALVSNFYFQLDCRPSTTNWGYLVQGSIRCRGDAKKVLTAMAGLGIVSVEYSRDSEKLCGLSHLEADICSSCHKYRKNVHFYIPDLSGRICIYMKSRTMAQHRLSGFPQTVDWFIKQQRLHEPFGDQYHGIPGIFHCLSCDLSPVVHQKRPMIQDTSRARKRTKIEETIIEVMQEE